VREALSLLKEERCDKVLFVRFFFESLRKIFFFESVKTKKSLSLYTVVELLGCN
jgi:hypothetical protein